MGSSLLKWLQDSEAGFHWRKPSRFVASKERLHTVELPAVGVRFRHGKRTVLRTALQPSLVVQADRCRADRWSGHAVADEPVKQLFNNKPTTLYSGEKSLQSRILFEICVLDDHARSSSTATSNCDSSRRVPRTVEE